MTGRGVARAASLAVGVAILALAIGFVGQLPFATATWPWPDGHFSYLFIGSIGVALAMSFLWVGLSGDLGVMAGGATTGIVMGGGMAAYLGLLLAGSRVSVLPNALFLTVSGLVSLGLFVWARRVPIQDKRAMPRVLRGCFVIFATVLILAATALVLRVPTVFPWPLNPDSSVMFGCIFYGNACYFLYALSRNRWSMAGAVLLSFLGYDVVLIPPFVAFLGSVNPDHRLSLVAYLAVLFFSAVVAIYFLAVHPSTRVTASTTPRDSRLKAASTK